MSAASGRLDAMAAADELLDHLGLPKDEPVDPVAAVVGLGLQLVVADLDELLGAFVPAGPGGVLLTSRRPPTVQRYTAAHELGHWALHRNRSSVDGEAEILSSPSTEVERQAQTFASYFLMPPPLVAAVVDRYGLSRGNVAPGDLYFASRDMGVSYEAAARRLRTHKLLKAQDVDRLLNTVRLDALRREFGGRRPRNGHANLWQVDERTLDATLAVVAQDEVVVTLPEGRASGWEWLSPADVAARDKRVRPLARPAPPEAGHRTAPRGLPSVTDRGPLGARAAPARPLAEATVGDGALPLVADEFSDHRQRATDGARATARSRVARGDGPAAPLVGGAGVRTLVFGCEDAGEYELDFAYTNAYEPEAPVAARLRVAVLVTPTPRGSYLAARLSLDLDAPHDDDPDDDAIFEVVR